MKEKIKPIFLTMFSMLFVLLTALSVGAQENQAQKNKWQFEITPYFLAAAMNGEAGGGGITTDIDMSFDDIWKNLDLGLMGVFEARKGNWIFSLDAVYFRLKDEKTNSWTGPAGIITVDGAVEATLVQQLYQGTVGYRMVDGKVKMDLTGGARYTVVDNDFNLKLSTSGELFPGGKRNLSVSKSWTDPVFGLRVIAPFAKQWSFFGYGDIGGFGVGSDITYQVIGGIRWQFSKVVSAKLAYRYLYQDFEDGDFVWDMSYHGPLLGFGFSF